MAVSPSTASSRSTRWKNWQPHLRTSTRARSSSPFSFPPTRRTDNSKGNETMNTTAPALTSAAWVEEFFRHVDAHDFEWVEAALTPDCVIDASGFKETGAEVVVLWMAGFF